MRQGATHWRAAKVQRGIATSFPKWIARSVRNRTWTTAKKEERLSQPEKLLGLKG